MNCTINSRQAGSYVFLSITLLILMRATSSCVSPKSVVYFQGDTSKLSTSKIIDTYVPTIQKNDMLSIIVGSLNQEANAIFNTVSEASASSTSYGTGGTSRQPLGYLVDNDGNVELPLIGKVNVADLTVPVASDTIRRRLLVYLKEPSVNIRNVNFKVSVLGEVGRPSVYVIPDEKITLPEAISLAGDLTIFGRRQNVMIIREEKGIRQYARVDLTSREIFDSPYYYLHKNDVVYVEPIKTRLNSTDRTMQIVPIILTAITALSLLVYRIR